MSALPTYSEWVYDSSDPDHKTIVPVSRAPSPCSKLSSTRKVHDYRIKRVHQERSTRDRINALGVLRSDIRWRKTQHQYAVSQQYSRKLYRYLPPWPLSMRLRCVELGAEGLQLLEEYYVDDGQIGRAAEEGLQIELYERPEWDRDDWVNVSLEMLIEAVEVRKKDQELKNDFKVLSNILSQLSTSLNSNIVDVAHQDSQGRLLTDLPPKIREMMGYYPQVKQRYIQLRAKETMSLQYRDAGSTRTELDKLLESVMDKVDFALRSDGTMNAEF